MLANNILWSILFFFVQPLFLIGLLYAHYHYRKRVNYTRATFRINFNKRNFERRDYLLKGIVPGILVSLLAIGLGVPLTIEWYFIYQVVAILLLLIGGTRFIQPIFTFSLSALAVYGLNQLDVAFPAESFRTVIPSSYIHLTETLNASPPLFTNLIFLSALILFITTFFMEKKKEKKLYPLIRRSKRGKNLAQYSSRDLWVLPFVFLVPGEVIEPFASWWPLLSINGNQYALLIAPILVGFHFTLSSQTLSEATTRLQKDFRFLAAFGLVLFGLSYFIPIFSRIAVVLLIIGGGYVLYRHRKRENRGTFRYGPANEGLRVIAVREDSPAERLDLEIGDILLELNEQPLLDTEEYNKLLAYNRSYIKVRIRRQDGEIVLAETPLYDDDYNNLGLLLLEN